VRPDQADQPRAVLVAHQQQVGERVELDLDSVQPHYPRPAVQGRLDGAGVAGLVLDPQPQQAVEAVAVATDGLGYHQSARGRFLQRVHRGHPAGHAAEQRGDQQPGQRPRVQLVAAGVGEVQLDGRRHQPRRQPPERRHQRHPRRDLASRLGTERRQVDAAGDRAGLEIVQHFARQDRADRLLRLAGGRAEVRGQHKLRMRAQRRVLRQRLGGEGVERGAGEMPGIERVDQGRLVHQPAARGVDQVRTGFHQRQAARVEQVGGVLGARDMQGDHVGPGQQLGQGHQRHAAVRGGRRRQERIMRGDFHADPARLARDRAADAAQADHAQPLAFEFEAGEAGLGPLPGLHPGVGARHVAREREQQRQRMFGGGAGVAVGGVHHRDAARGGRFHVDGVDAGAGATDHPEAVAAGQAFGGDRRGRTHQQCIDAVQRRGQRGGILERVGGDGDVPAGSAEQ